MPFDEDGILLAAGPVLADMSPAQRMGQRTWTARTYDAWRRRSLTLLTGEPFPPDREWHLHFGELPVGRRRVYLDNATATGHLGRALARRLSTTDAEFVVIANDLSLPMLRQALNLARRDGIGDRMFFIHAASEQLPLRPGSVDGILCGGSLNEFTNADRVLQEWARVLSPGGAVSVMLQTQATGWKGWLQRMLAPRLGLSIETAEEAIARFDAVFERRRWLTFGPILFLSGGRRNTAATRFRPQAA